MRSHRATRCALVQFVHARCNLPSSCSAAAVDNATVGSTESIERVHIGDTAGLAAAVRSNWPVVLTGAALPEGNLLQHMRELCGHREVPVRLPPPPPRAIEPEISDDAGSGTGRVTFGETAKRALYTRMDRWRLYRVIDEVQAVSAASAGSGELRPMRCYAANVPIEARLPELAPHILPVIEAVEGASLRAPLGSAVPLTPVLYLGAARQRTPLHFDPTENLTAVVQGSKIFRLFPPWASPELRPHGGRFAAAACWFQGVVPAVYAALDPWASDEASRPWSLDVQVNAGEVLYLPVAWWHAVEGSLEANVSVVFGFEPSESKADPPLSQ